MLPSSNAQNTATSLFFLAPLEQKIFEVILDEFNLVKFFPMLSFGSYE